MERPRDQRGERNRFDDEDPIRVKNVITSGPTIVKGEKKRDQLSDGSIKSWQLNIYASLASPLV